MAQTDNKYQPDDKVYLWRFTHGPFLNEDEQLYYAIGVVTVNGNENPFEEEFWSEDGRDFVEIQEYFDKQVGIKPIDVAPYIVSEGWEYDER